MHFTGSLTGKDGIMASLITDPNGHRRIGFKSPIDGRSKTIRLGRLPASEAEKYCEYLGILAVCHANPEAVPAAVLKWALDLDDTLYHRVAATGLLPPRNSGTTNAPTMGKLVADVTAELVRTKPLTQQNYARIFAMIIEHFGADRPVASVSPRDADTFVTWMRTEKQIGPATASRRIRGCRFLFKRAVRWEWTDQNPFEGIKAGQSINHARKAFVPQEVIERLIAATNDHEFRCVLALCRYGALRCPSELLQLRWSDVRWDEGQLLVRSPKTEHHVGGEARVVPLFPRLHQILLDAYTALPEGAAEFVVSSTRDAGVNFRTKLERLLKRVGVAPWPKLFHNLRASRESELCLEYPLATVCQWLGHRPEVAAVHYLTDPDHDATFRKAAGLDGPAVRTKATRKATRGDAKLGENRGNWAQAKMPKLQQNRDFALSSSTPDRAQQDSNL
jgi:integrase